MFKLFTTFLIVTCFGCQLIMAQDLLVITRPVRKPFYNPWKNCATINLTQLAVLEYRIGYERFLKPRKSLGIELAYKPEMGNTISMVVVGSNNMAPYQAAQSFTGLLSHKWFLTKEEDRRVSFYLETRFMLRYYEYAEKFYSQYNRKESKPSALMSGYHFVYALTEQLGCRIFLPSLGGTFVDLFAGLSFRIKSSNTQKTATCTLYHDGGNCDREKMLEVSDDSVPFEKADELVVSPQLGVKLGYAF
jgi:hypothetical protein